MKALHLLLCLAFLSGLAAPPEGFSPLHDGQTANGWAGAIENYTFTDGVIRCRKGKGGTIYTEAEYRDFQVTFEFQLPPGGNNGLALRYPGHGDTAYTGMCELQILDNTAPKYADLDPRQYHGSAYGMAAAKRGHLKKPGEWNQQTVTVVGSTIKVELNKVVILEADLSTVSEYMDNKPHPGKNRLKGHFGFAGHGHAVGYRNIQIKKIEQ